MLFQAIIYVPIIIRLSMGCLYSCIVTCAYLGNARRIATMVAPLLLTSGPAQYEAVLHNNLFSICVCAKGCMQGTFRIEPGKHESMLHMEGQPQYVEGV